MVDLPTMFCRTMNLPKNFSYSHCWLQKPVFRPASSFFNPSVVYGVENISLEGFVPSKNTVPSLTPCEENIDSCSVFDVDVLRDLGMKKKKKKHNKKNRNRVVASPWQ